MKKRNNNPSCVAETKPPAKKTKSMNNGISSCMDGKGKHSVIQTKSLSTSVVLSEKDLLSLLLSYIDAGDVIALLRTCKGLNERIRFDHKYWYEIYKRLQFSTSTTKYTPYQAIFRSKFVPFTKCRRHFKNWTHKCYIKMCKCSYCDIPDSKNGIGVHRFRSTRMSPICKLALVRKLVVYRFQQFRTSWIPLQFLQAVYTTLIRSPGSVKYRNGKLTFKYGRFEEENKFVICDLNIRQTYQQLRTICHTIMKWGVSLDIKDYSAKYWKPNMTTNKILQQVMVCCMCPAILNATFLLQIMETNLQIIPGADLWVSFLIHLRSIKDVSERSVLFAACFHLEVKLPAVDKYSITSDISSWIKIWREERRNLVLKNVQFMKFMRSAFYPQADMSDINRSALLSSFIYKDVYEPYHVEDKLFPSILEKLAKLVSPIKTHILKNVVDGWMFLIKTYSIEENCPVSMKDMQTFFNNMVIKNITLPTEVLVKAMLSKYDNKPLLQLKLK